MVVIHVSNLLLLDTMHQVQPYNIQSLLLRNTLPVQQTLLARINPPRFFTDLSLDLLEVSMILKQVAVERDIGPRQLT